MALRNALKKLDELFDDLSSLHVQTFTGSVSTDLTQGDGAKIENLRKAVSALRAEGTVQLVAEAYYQFDGDSYNFLTSEDVPARAVEMHTAAVEAGMKTRQGLMELVKGVFD